MIPRRLRAKRASKQPYLTEIMQLRRDSAEMQASIGGAVASALMAASRERMSDFVPFGGTR